MEEKENMKARLCEVSNFLNEMTSKLKLMDFALLGMCCGRQGFGERDVSIVDDEILKAFRAMEKFREELDEKRVGMSSGKNYPKRRFERRGTVVDETEDPRV